DLKLNSTQDLRKNAVYSFNYDATENAERFRLHFKSTTGINDPANNGISVYSFQQEVVVNNTTNIPGEVWIFDMTGRELTHSSVGSNTKTSIPMQVAVGAYIVKVVTAKATVNQKVFIK
ncbi:MAG: T9SS type A sorting domain-containing protein, partial [Bacteroidales bacterium]